MTTEDQPLAPRPRPRTVAIACLTIAVAAATIAWLLAVAAGPVSTTDQCSKPVSERVGGWVCPTP